MKNIIITISVIMVFSISIVTASGVLGKSEREKELSQALEYAMQATVQTMTVDNSYKYDFGDRSSYEAELIQEMAVKISSKIDNLTVNIITADTQNGLLDVAATETFRYPLGNKGKITVRRTMIIDYDQTGQEAA